MRCKGHCRIGTYCNKLTGRCDDGCEAQWTGDFCERKNATINTNIKLLNTLKNIKSKTHACVSKQVRTGHNAQRRHS